MLKFFVCFICTQFSRAQHINFGRSQPPRKIIRKCPFGIPRMNSPEFPGSAFFSLAFLYSLIGNLEFPGIFRHFPGKGFWGSRNAFSGEDEVDMSGRGEIYHKKLFCKVRSGKTDPVKFQGGLEQGPFCL